MSTVLAVDITAGVPVTGTGTVSTIDALMAQATSGNWKVAQQGTWNVTVNAALPTGTNNIGSVNQGTSPWVVSGNVTASGTVTTNQGTAGGSPWLVQISDGTNSPTIKSAAAVSGDLGMVVQLHPNSLNTNGAKTSANSAPTALPTDAATLAIAFDTTQLMNGVSGAPLTPTKAKITATVAGTYTAVAAVSGKKIRVLSAYINSAATNTINFQSHTTTANSDGHPAYSATGGMVLPFNPIGWFDSTVGEALDIVIGSNGEVSGQFSWIAV